MQRISRPRLKWWLALAQVVLLLAALAAPAAAASNEPSVSGIQLLQSYGVVQGDGQGNLSLDKPITRAEMFAIMVRALGGENEVGQYKGFNIFSDTKGHWAEGYINYASIKKLVKGDGNGTVRPQDQISYAEALTLLVRLAGQEPTSGQWPLNILLTAMDLKIVPQGINAGNIQDRAVRGPIFQSLAQTLVTAKTADNKTLLQTYLDHTPPQITVTQPTSPVSESSARVTGTHVDAVSILVNNQSATISGSTWTANVDLQMGENTILVVAKDTAGNEATSTTKVTRALPINRLEITGPSQVRKGGTATYQVNAYDNASKSVSLTGVSAKVEGNIGTFDLQTGVLTASSTPATGKIVVTAGSISASANVTVSGVNPSATALRIRPVNDGRAVSVSQDMVVTVEVLDTNGNVLTDDFGRVVSLSANGISGLTVTPTFVETSAGVTTFRVRSSVPGGVTLLASSNGLTAANASTAFGTNVRVTLTAEPSSLAIGTNNVASRIRATLVNEQGQPIANNTGNDIRITVSRTGTDGMMSDQDITIYRGLSTSTSSGDDALYVAGTAAGTAQITGVVTSGQTISVDPTSVSVTAPQIGSAAKWDMIYPPTNPVPNAVAPAYFSVRMADTNGATVPANFAFQLEITTSNNEAKSNGIPQGLRLYLAGNSVNPISDGIAEGALNDGDDVIVRTVGGMATFAVQYDKVGQVNVKVVGAPGVVNAYGSDGTIGAAVTASGISSQSFTINFTTTPTGVKLLADSALGTEQPVAAANSNTSQSIKLRAYFTDGTSWIPGATGYVTLTKVSGTSTVEPSIKTVSVTNGKAEFLVTTTGNPGTDVYQISNAKNASGVLLTSPDSLPLSIVVQNQVPGAPSVLGAQGMKNGVPSGGWYYVAPDDTHLQLELAPSAASGYAVVNLYQSSYSTPFYTSEPVDLSTGSVRIQVPKNKLPDVKQQYLVGLKNAVGESTRSVTPDLVTNAKFSSGITITAVKYDRVNSRLYLYGTGFGTSGSSYPDIVYTHLLSITDASLIRAGGAGTINLGPASVVSMANSVITLDVSALNNALALLSGVDVTLAASNGWYVKYTGEIAQGDSGDVVGPMAKIDYVTYDKTNRRLILTGAGFNTGNLSAYGLKLVKGITEIPLASATSYRISDMEWSLSVASLSTVTAALDADLGYTLSGANGWFYDASLTSIQQNAFATVPLYDRVMVSSVTYDSTNQILTINGAGFTGASIDASALSIVNTTPDPDVVRSLAGTLLIGAGQFTDSKIMIKLDAGSNPLAGAGRLTGSNLYVIGNAGWLTKTSGAVTRIGAPIPVYMLLLPTQN